MSDNQNETLKEIDSGDTFLQDLHRQFAENANNNQNLFLSLFGTLFVIFTAFGYVLINTANSQGAYIFQNAADQCANSSDKITFSTNILFVVSFAVIAILSFLIITLITLGWGFRREQIVNDSIRQCALKKLASPKADVSAYTFIMEQNNYGLGKDIHSMPDFYRNFAAFLFFTKISLTVFLFYAFPENHIEVIAILCFVISTIALEFTIWFNKYNKLKKKKITNILKCCREILSNLNILNCLISSEGKYESFKKFTKPFFYKTIEEIKRKEAIEEDFKEKEGDKENEFKNIFVLIGIFTVPLLLFILIYTIFF